MILSNNENIRWVNISDPVHGVRFRAWDHGRGGFPVRAGLVLRNGSTWLACWHGHGFSAALEVPFATHTEAQREVEACYIPGCQPGFSFVTTPEADLERIQDALVHLAILTGQDVLDINFAHEEDVISHLVWYEHITGQSVGVASIEARIQSSWGLPLETPSGDDFRTHCIVRGLND